MAYNSSYSGAQIDAAVGEVVSHEHGLAGLDAAGKVASSAASSAVVTLSANTTLAASHEGRTLMITAASAIAITLPAGLTDGAEIELIDSTGHGASLSGTLFISGSGSVQSASLSENGIAAAKLISGVWYLSGEVDA